MELILKLILSFEHEHYATEDLCIGIEKAVCIEGPSLEAVRTALCTLVETTLSRYFHFCGADFLVRDFRQPITPQRLEQAKMLAKHLNKPAPTVFEINGEPHTFKKFRVQSLDDWFERNSRVFHEPAELALVH
jgi:hypothetical protein